MSDVFVWDAQMLRDEILVQSNIYKFVFVCPDHHFKFDTQESPSP